MRKFIRIIQDSWEAIGSVLGVAIMVYEFVAQLYSAKGLSINTAVWVGLGLFVFFGILAFIKEIRKRREAQNSKPSNNVHIENQNNGGQSLAAQNINAPVTIAKNITDSHDMHNTTTYNTYNINKAQEEIHQLPTITKTAARPKKDELAYQMGMNIQEFEIRFRSIRRDISGETEQQYNFARDMLIKILDEDLPQAELVFREAKQIREKIFKLSREYFDFGARLGILISAQNHVVFDKTALDNIFGGLWNNDGPSISSRIIFLIRQLIELLNQEGIENYQTEKINELPNVEIKELRVRLGRFNSYLTNRQGKNFDDPDPAKVMYYEVVVSNNPLKRTPKSASRDVRADITYYTSEHSEIGSTTGAWMDLENLKFSKTTHLPYNGDSRVLILAIRFFKESSLFMYGIETNPNYFGKRMRDFRYRLSEQEPKDIKLKVHLIGENLDKEYDLILHYAGKDGESKIERL